MGSSAACSSAAATPMPSTSSGPASSAAASQRITITAPDDWHLHVRDGKAMASVVPHTAQHYQRAIIMPNLTPPVTTAHAVRAFFLCGKRWGRGWCWP